MNAYDLPTSLTIGEVVHPIRYGWRAALDIFAACADPELDEGMRAEAILEIFYPNWSSIPLPDIPEALQKACDFLDCGQTHDASRQSGKLVDWEHDASVIIPAINQVAGREVRMDPNTHWWTFFGWYMSIGESVFSTVLHIRKKLKKHQKLEKWEEDFYRNNRDMVDLSDYDSEEIKKEKESILRFL